MTIEVDVEIEGLSELDEALAALTDRLAKKSIDGALSFAANPMVKDARQSATIAEADHLMKYGSRYVQVRRGLLRESIRKRKLKKRELSALGVSAGVAIYVGKSTKQKLYPRYWHFIEFGTSKMVSNPYLRPAFDRNKELVVQRFSQKLAQNIEKYTPIIEGES